MALVLTLQVRQFQLRKSYLKWMARTAPFFGPGMLTTFLCMTAIEVRVISTMTELLWHFAPVPPGGLDLFLLCVAVDRMPVP